MLKSYLEKLFSLASQGTLSKRERGDFTAPVDNFKASMYPNCYMGDNRVLTRTKHDIRLYLDTRDIILTPLVILNGEWEPETSRVMAELLRGKMNFVDVGANIGYFTCLAAQSVLKNGGKVWAFEADPETFEYLVDNVNLNWHFQGIFLENKAVYSEATRLTLYRRHKYKGNTSIASIDPAELIKIRDAQTSFEVEAVTLDSYFSSIPDSIDLLKIDVEGAEPHVLKGMSGLIERYPKMKIMVEWSPGQIYKTGARPGELVDFFSSRHYRWELIQDKLVSIKPDDLEKIDYGMLLLTK